jgi:hypothetical protein
MTHTDHPRTPATTILFAIVVFVSIACVAVGYVVLGLYAAEQHREAITAQASSASKDKTIDRKDAQLADIVDKYLALAKDCQKAADCVTTAPAPDVIQEFIQGTPGQPGKTPTASDVIQAIEAYCSARNDCAGPPGQNGADSTVPGPAGQNGIDGRDGRDGSDGRGITAVTCVIEEDLTTALRFTFTDQTTQDVTASCIPQ